MREKIRSILLVDDDPDDQFLFQEALSETDGSILYLSSYNGLEAIEKLNSGEIEIPDVIFLDVNMPRMNGIDCLKELQKYEKLKNLPVLMYSTSCSADSQKESFKNGAVGYVQKPNDFWQLCDKLKVILSKGLDFRNDMPLIL